MIDGSVIGKVFIELDDDKRDLMAINTVMDTPQRAGPKCTLLTETLRVCYVVIYSIDSDLTIKYIETRYFSLITIINAALC